jgi:hypothetical protein
LDIQLPISAGVVPRRKAAASVSSLIAISYAHCRREREHRALAGSRSAKTLHGW